MTAERKIDISKWNGPMTVVGYPDFSAVKYMTSPAIKVEASGVNVKPSVERSSAQPKHRA